jgi:hypothetical protein
MSLRNAGTILVAVLSLSQATPSQADWQWLEASRPKALDRLMPLAARPGLLVAYRSYRDLYQDVLEHYLRIEREPQSGGTPGVFMAIVVTPVGRSVQQQLMDGHRARPGLTLDAMLHDIAVSRLVVTSSSCPSLVTSIDALSGLNITIPPRDVIVLHPVTHHFVIDLGTLHMDGTLYDDDAPLVRWAEQAMATVRQCGAA